MLFVVNNINESFSTCKDLTSSIKIQIFNGSKLGLNDLFLVCDVRDCNY